jgi:hypothetical protein
MNYLPADQVDALLNAWESARAERSARLKAYSKAELHAYLDGEREGQQDRATIRAAALAAAREALELLPVSLIDDRFGPADERRYVLAVRLTTALAAIDNLRGES